VSAIREELASTKMYPEACVSVAEYLKVVWYSYLRSLSLKASSRLEGKHAIGATFVRY
jgi:hypothetical protein